MCAVRRSTRWPADCGVSRWLETRRLTKSQPAASVVDPFGNILGIIYNPHYLQILGANCTA